MPAQRGRRRCERTSKSTAFGWLDRCVRPTVVTSSRAGVPTPSSSDRRNHVTTKWSRCPADCMRRRPRSSARASLRKPPVPPWAEVDVFVAADRAAWETVPLRIAKGVEQLETPTPDGRKSLELIAGLATLRKPVQSPGPARARRSVRDSAVLGQYGARNHRHHAVLAAGCVGRRRRCGRRDLVGRCRRGTGRPVGRSPRVAADAFYVR